MVWYKDGDFENPLRFKHNSISLHWNLRMILFGRHYLVSDTAGVPCPRDDDEQYFDQNIWTLFKYMYLHSHICTWQRGLRSRRPRNRRPVGSRGTPGRPPPLPHEFSWGWWSMMTTDNFWEAPCHRRHRQCDRTSRQAAEAMCRRALALNSRPSDCDVLMIGCWWY